MNHSKLTLLGLGLVGRSLLKLLIGENYFRIDDIRVVEMDEGSFGYFESLGGKRENFLCLKLDSKCYSEIFGPMKKGDYLIRLAEGSDDTVLVRECLERGIHYLCASDDYFADRPLAETFPYRTHFYQFKELIKGSKGGATSILQFGINPGLISVLTKKALMDIVEKDEGDFVTKNRERLKSLAEQGDFPLLAKELQVSAFIEADLDSTQTDIEEKENEVYNTWNVNDFYEEMNDRSIQKLGTLVSLEEHLNRLAVSPDQIYYYNKHDGTLVLDIPGKNLETKAYSEGETFTGCVDSHEELFSLHDYYTIRDDKGEIDYAPSVMFVYRPCDLAINSVWCTDPELHRKKQYRIVPITKDRMTAGTEAVGITVEGKNFRPVYVGVAPVFDPKSPETPSVLEVSATLYAAMRYIANHPEEGILYPEYLEVNEMLSYTERFLPVISQKLG